MKTRYLFVRQGEIGRWQYTNQSSAYGLYTDGFYNCVVLAFQSHKKISLIHADPMVTLSDVKSEIKWHGGDCKKNLYYKDNANATETIQDLFGVDPIKNQFTLKIIKKMRTPDNKIVFDMDVSPPLLPFYGNDPIAEYESDVILVNQKSIIALKTPQPNQFTFISLPEKIKSVYQQYQNTEFKTNIHHGSKQKEIKQNLQELARSDEIFQFVLQAIHSENLSSINTFLKMADINQPLKFGYTLLILAACEGKIKIVKRLLACKADPNSAMNTGSTPLFVAAGRGHQQVVQALLEAKADPNITTHSGARPIDTAKAQGHPAIVNLIQHWEAMEFKQAGNQFFECKNYHQALECFDKALKEESIFKEIWFNKGLTLMNLKQPEKAWQAFARALEIDANYRKAIKHKLICENQCGAKLFFGVVDLKITPDDQIKILKFGRGLTSDTMPYDQHVPPSSNIQSQFLNLIKEEKLPIHLNRKFDWREADNKEFIETLQCGQAWPKTTTFTVDDLATYRGIYIGSDQVPTSDDILHEGDSLGAQLLCADKVMMNHLFMESKCDVIYRPKAKAYSTQYNPSLADEIKK